MRIVDPGSGKSCPKRRFRKSSFVTPRSLSDIYDQANPSSLQHPDVAIQIESLVPYCKNSHKAAILGDRHFQMQCRCGTTCGKRLMKSRVLQGRFRKISRAQDE